MQIKLDTSCDQNAMTSMNIFKNYAKRQNKSTKNAEMRPKRGEKVDHLHERYMILFDIKLKVKSVAYSSQGSQTGQLDSCKWLADGSTTG